MARNVIIPADPDLPQLETIRERTPFIAHLQKAIEASQGRDLTVNDLFVTECQHRKGVTCRLMMEVEFKTADGYREWQTYIVRAGRPGNNNLEQQYQEALRNGLVAPRFGPPVLFFREWNMLLWAHPNDPNLPGLRLLEAREALADYVKAHPQQIGLEDTSVLAVSVQQKKLKVVPGKRGGFLVQIQYQNPAGEERTHAVYAKLFRKGYGREAYELLQTIWQHPLRQSGDLQIPRPYAFDDERSIMWQEAIQGVPLSKNIEYLQSAENLAAEIGGKLARLHAIRVRLPEQMTLDYQLKEIQQAADRISRKFPTHADRARQLASRLQKAAQRFSGGLRTLVHGSFKFSHILITPTGIQLIDFDAANLGDPGYDVGRFMAHILKMQASGKMPRELAQAINQQFCQGYNAHAQTPLSQEYINWFCASHLLASQAFKSVKKNKPALLEALFDLTEAYCPD